MNNIKKQSKFLKFGIIAYFLIELASWIFSLLITLRLINYSNDPHDLIEGAALWTKITKTNWSIGFSYNSNVGLLDIIPLAMWCFILQRLFSNYSQGKIFTAENVKLYKYCGIILLISEIVIRLLSGLLDYSIYPASGLHASSEILLLLPRLSFSILGIAIISISHIMQEALKLREDTNLTI